MADFLANRRAVIGAGMMLGAGSALATPAAAQDGGGGAGGQWQPASEPIDAWLDKAGTRHRMVFDTISTSGGIASLDFANNFYHSNVASYALKPEQIGVVIVFRHGSTPFGYNDAMWAKYGAHFADQMALKGKQAIRSARVNPLLTAASDAKPMPKGLEWVADNTLTRLAAIGARFAVCGLGTQGIAMDLADDSSKAAAIEAELRANLVPGALIVPAGIVAVNRAQEHSYAFAYMG